MLKRKMINYLQEWKDTNSQKALVISGARQVGKTFIVREFAKTSDNYVELNFLEYPEYKRIFEGSLKAADIIQKVNLSLTDSHIGPGKTLFFLDEIQECPNAITALKFLAAEAQLDVIASGSALGMVYNRVTSWPVGSIEYLKMNSLDFEEFLWAMGTDDLLVSGLRNNFAEKKPVDGFVHEALMKYLRMYMAIGGMPEAVQSFADTKDYGNVHKIQRNIYRDYLADIARYAEPGMKIKAENCYRSIPSQLSKENHKFQYKIVENKGTARKYESSIDWLVNAHMAMAVKNTSYVEYPLQAHEIPDNIRLYPTDIGMLTCTYDYSLKSAILEDIDMDINPSGIVLRTAKGGLYEALAADMLYKAGHENLHFHRNDQGTAEIEFLIEGKDGVVPVEVKAGSHSGRKGTKTLNNLLKKESIQYGYKLSSQNVGVSGKKITLPMYMCMFLNDQAD